MRLPFFGTKKVDKRLPRHPFDQSLIYKFTDTTGMHYFQFPDETAITVERLGKIKEFFIWISRGLTDEQLTELIDQAEAAWVDYLKTGKHPGKIGSILNEIRLRKDTIAPADLYYSYLAVQYIREDEDPRVWNQQVQDEKVLSFKEGAKDYDSFFFAMPELKQLCRLLNITHERWSDFIVSCIMGEERHRKVVKLYSSTTSSGSTGETSKPS
jgi:hypothetical protein